MTWQALESLLMRLHWWVLKTADAECSVDSNTAVLPGLSWSFTRFIDPFEYNTDSCTAIAVDFRISFLLQSKLSTKDVIFPNVFEKGFGWWKVVDSNYWSTTEVGLHEGHRCMNSQLVDSFLISSKIWVHISTVVCVPFSKDPIVILNLSNLFVIYCVNMQRALVENNSSTVSCVEYKILTICNKLIFP